MARPARGTPGHPVVLPRRLFPSLLELRGDQGARALLAQEEESLRLIPLPGANATTDLDTAEDWAAWRARGADEA